MIRKLALLVLLACPALFAQTTDFGVLNCIGGSGARLDKAFNTQAGSLISYTADQCAINIRPDGHGTAHIDTETGIVSLTGLYQFTVAFPQQITILEMHGSITDTNWCALLNQPAKTQFNLTGQIVGFTTFIAGVGPGGMLENLLSDTTFTDDKTTKFPVKADFPGGVQISSLIVYHHTDQCSWPTFKVSLDLVF